MPAAIARTIAGYARRPADLAVRYGGEEFVLLLPGSDAAACQEVGERIREAIRALGLPHILNLPAKAVTVSLGGATGWPGSEGADDPASLIAAADKALYAAKHGGRDRLRHVGPGDRLARRRKRLERASPSGPCRPAACPSSRTWGRPGRHSSRSVWSRREGQPDAACRWPCGRECSRSCAIKTRRDTGKSRRVQFGRVRAQGHDGRQDGESTGGTSSCIGDR